MKAADLFPIFVAKSLKPSKFLFKQLLLQELELMGVSTPELPIKTGGIIGQEWLDYVIDRVYASKDGCCPATVSVLGAVGAQEVIKSISHLYLPISQLMMFESLNSLSEESHLSSNTTHPREGADSKAKLSDSYSLQNVLSTYGPEVTMELSKLKVFIVGSGAIGCELLKNFALLGIGSGNSTDFPTKNDSENQNEEASLWKQYHLDQGGILLTDMDCIEKSNLNRQLLFREEHIGQSKSVVAAEQIRKLNSLIQIHPLTMKMDEETEEFFDERFWKEADLIITALVSCLMNKIMTLFNLLGNPDLLG
jgi:ubiquitin-activating enzyme E1